MLVNLKPLDERSGKARMSSAACGRTWPTSWDRLLHAAVQDLTIDDRQPTQYQFVWRAQRARPDDLDPKLTEKLRCCPNQRRRHRPVG